MFELRNKLLVTFIVMLLSVNLLGVCFTVEGDTSITVTDARGETITFKSPPDRIISFMPSNTEILFHLGMGDRVVAVDDFSNYPSEAKGLPKVGNAFSVDYEKIVNMSADVVVTPAFNTQMIDTLENYNQTVVATGSTDFEDIYTDMELLGDMCGIGDTADEKVNEIKTKIESITEYTADLSKENRTDVFYITSVEPIYTPGAKTFQDRLINMAGGNNIAADKEGWVTISEEEIVGDDPDIIIAPESIKGNIENLTDKATWKGISAVENGHVYYVNSDIMSRPGPRVVQAEQQLTNITTNVLDIESSQETNQEEGTPGFTMVFLFSALLLSVIYRRKKMK